MNAHQPSEKQRFTKRASKKHVSASLNMTSSQNTNQQLDSNYLSTQKTIDLYVFFVRKLIHISILHVEPQLDIEFENKFVSFYIFFWCPLNVV